jgi:hypothetical protein
MIRGALIAESIRIGARLDGPLVLRGLARERRTDPAPGQPRDWTVVEFDADEAADEGLARSLAGALLAEGGWYANYSTPTECVVVFAGRVFRYPLGDAEGRGRAAAYGRSVGVPPSQLDWTE